MPKKKKKMSVWLPALTTLAAVLLIAAASQALAYDRQSNSENGVRVDVVPVQLENGLNVRFEMRLNSHSIELDQNLKDACVLKDDLGNTYPAVGWNGSPPGGHHRDGMLLFPELSQDCGSVTLVVKGVADVTERSFTWRVNR